MISKKTHQSIWSIGKYSNFPTHLFSPSTQAPTGMVSPIWPFMTSTGTRTRPISCKTLCHRALRWIWGRSNAWEICCQHWMASSTPLNCHNYHRMPWIQTSWQVRQLDIWETEWICCLIMVGFTWLYKSYAYPSSNGSTSSTHRSYYCYYLSRAIHVAIASDTSESVSYKTYQHINIVDLWHSWQLQQPTSVLWSSRNFSNQLGPSLKQHVGIFFFQPSALSGPFPRPFHIDRSEMRFGAGGTHWCWGAHHGFTEAALGHWSGGSGGTIVGVVGEMVK